MEINKEMFKSVPIPYIASQWVNLARVTPKVNLKPPPPPLTHTVPLLQMPQHLPLPTYTYLLHPPQMIRTYAKPLPYLKLTNPVNKYNKTDITRKLNKK